jgi:multidrug resistance efflux pump
MRPLLSASAQADNRTRAVSVDCEAATIPAPRKAEAPRCRRDLQLLSRDPLHPREDEDRSLQPFWKCSPLIVPLLLMFGLFIPMGWGAPQGPALVVRNSVAVVPDVAGEVTDVPVQANQPLKAGDVLFKIDPTPYQSQLDALTAQLKFEELRLSPMTQLQSTDSGRAFDVQQRQADVDKLKAQVEGAKWNLEKTVERAPSDGCVTNVGLLMGALVANLPLSPVMAFISTTETVVGVEVQQIYTRYIEPGQEVEVTFKFFPGQVFTGKVVSLLEATATGQGRTLSARSSCGRSRY